MAAELSKYLEEALNKLPSGHPHRSFLESISKETEDLLLINNLATRVRTAFEEIPDDTPISDIVPSHFFTLGPNKVAYRGPYQGMTRDEIYSMYPQFYQVFNDSSAIEKVYLTNMRFLNGKSAISANLLSLSDLRNAGDETLDHILGKGKTRTLVKIAFSPSPQSI